MPPNLIARAAAVIDAPRAAVWDALVTPAAIREYFFGAEVTSDWTEGSPITWRGEWQGKRYEDRGAILALDPGRLLQYSHYSPLSGLPDEAESYHTVTFELSDEGKGTRVDLTQDNNASEQAREHSEKNWETVLSGLKAYVERGRAG